MNMIKNFEMEKNFPILLLKLLFYFFGIGN